MTQIARTHPSRIDYWANRCRRLCCLALVPMLAPILLLQGCGGDGSSTESGNATTAPSSSSTPPSSSSTPLSVTTSTLQPGQVGIAYSATLTATGGTGHYTWSISGGALPAGLALADSGAISGTPTAAVSADKVTFSVTDSGNSALTGTSTLALTIAPAAASVSVSVAPLTASINIGASQQFTATVHNAASSAVTWQVNGVAGGNSSLGTISSSGLYTAPSALPSPATVTVTAVAAADTAISASAQLTILSGTAALQVTTTALPSATVNVPYSQVLTASGGTGTYLWTLTSAVSGFSLSPSGLLSGTAASTTPLSFQIKVTDGSGASSYTTVVLSLPVRSPTAGASFYVATTGSDSNPGSLQEPWKTIQHAASSVAAGSTVFVRGGVYNESVNISVSGSAAAGQTVFQSYTGETAIVDGTGLTPSGTQGLFNIIGQSYVTIQGFEVRNFQTSSASVVPAGIWVTGSGTYLQILDNVVHDIVTTSEASGNAFGIAVYGSEAPAAIQNITISGNQVYNLKTGNSETVNVDGNVNGFVISNNVIHDNDNIGIDAIGYEGVSPDSAYDYARNGEISGNTVYNISAGNNPGEGNEYSADGIYVDGGSQITIERNLVYDNDINIEVASEHAGRVGSYVTVRSNLVYAARTVGITIGGYSAGVGGTDHCTIVNNTLYGNDTLATGSGEFQIQYYATNNVFENNVVYATSQGLLINDFTNSEPDPVQSDYNLFFSPLAATAVTFLWNGPSYQGLTSWGTASSNDAHSSYANPQFVSTGTPDFHLEPSSPAVGAGNNLGQAVEGTLDFASEPRVQGSTIDIGAYEQ